MFKKTTALYFKTGYKNSYVSDYWGGSFVLLFIIAFYFIALKAIFSVGSDYSWQDFLQDSYVHRVITFSFAQAFLSALLSILIGGLFARAFFYQNFIAKKAILKLFSVTFVLPALVAIFGLMGIYGHSGWLAKLVQFLGIDWHPEMYGLAGILIAHLFFNIPLAARMFLQSFANIPSQQRQLAAQLNIRGWQFIRLIELPYLRQQLLPIFVLVFMLCFTSFTIVLTLGGGPKYTTLEVAIYQSIVFEFDLAKAGLFAILQFIFCFILFAISSIFTKSLNTNLPSRHSWFDTQKSAVKIWQVFIISIVILFIFLPLFNTVFTALTSNHLMAAWENPQLWRALTYSLSIAPVSALVSVSFAMAMLILSRRLQWQSQRYLAHSIVSIGMIILAIPTLVLAMGLFIALRDIDFSEPHLFVIVVLCNALASMPFVLKIFTVPMNNNMQYYEKLCQSLGIKGWQRWRLIEWYNLRSPIKYAFALACALSLGDFTAIALFGSQDFTSLPYLLYQQLGSYRIADASVTAFILLIFCGGIFIVVDRE
ncbi:thiamine/thiamine pyrophosphate ABC transporter permease ThiP [Bisgaardia hudsonensis]|uniref:thiamine/thiamine pyrophosphate ABC transporter permease ThiP n=1 Tax=Bisgaardia hudsonensis TaxID=109472 RepID=UPI003AB9A87E|nr:thiamine/thiamine pyrophosphate ABC transporter permease ThiP [Bisgaardia hudsonensis]